nr:FCD domain-containing protein [Chromobacterium sp. ASV5]
MELPALKSERIYHQIFNVIGQYIVDGHYPVGGYLPAERELSQQLGVSRSSVREALVALEIVGIVEIQRGKGVCILRAPQQWPFSFDAPSVSDGSVEDLLEARYVLEGELAALAAARASEAQMAEMERLIQAMAAQKEENAASQAHDRQFHMLIAEMTGNDVLRDKAGTLWNQRYAPLFQQLESHYGKSDWESVVGEHRAVAAAIRARDAQAAREAMHAHLQSVSAKLLRDDPSAPN